jgi:ubiquitin carboxyl-terminal hydrolase 1
MSVGHYIAYTCSLDIYNEYVSCVHEKRRLSLSNGTTKIKSQHGSLPSGEKNSGLMKKLIYGRSKASSSGDMSKSLKPINGLSKIMMNGIEKLNLNSSEKINNSNSNSTNGGSNSTSFNSNNINGTSTSQFSHNKPKTVCNSANCCGIYVKDFANIVENYHNNIQTSVSNSEKNGEKTASSPTSTTANNVASTQNDTNHSTDDANNESEHQNSNNNNTSSTSSKPSINDLNQKVWYMCDDDKIKIMTQREFEEALSKNQKVMITPYLLFYARYTKNSKHSDYE